MDMQSAALELIIQQNNTNLFRGVWVRQGVRVVFWGGGAYGLRFGVSGSGFRVESFGFRLRVKGVGFRVQGGTLAMVPAP